MATNKPPLDAVSWKRERYPLGGAENAGHENAGREIAGHEIAGHENEGPTSNWFGANIRMYTLSKDVKKSSFSE